MSEYIVKESGYPGRLETEIVGELVRCEDCSYYKSIKRTDRHQCVNDFVAVIETKPDDFCSRAERRTDGSD